MYFKKPLANTSCDGALTLAALRESWQRRGGRWPGRRPGEQAGLSEGCRSNPGLVSGAASDVNAPNPPSPMALKSQ